MYMFPFEIILSRNAKLTHTHTHTKATQLEDTSAQE